MRASLLALTAVLVSSTSAHAWVAPSFSVVRKLAQKHDNIEDARFQNKVTLYKDNGEVAKTFSEVLVVPNRDRISIRLSDDAGNHIVTHTRRLISPQNSRSSDLRRPLAYDLLFVSDSANIYDHFKALGLPLKTETELYAEKEGALPYKPEEHVALNRYDTRVATVVAAGSMKELSSSHAPQLWVEKDSGLPLKALFPSAPDKSMSSDALEYRFEGFIPHTGQKSFLFPRTMQVFRDGKLWVKVETQDVKLGTKAKLEDPKSEHDVSGDVKEFLENYFKWVR